MAAMYAKFLKRLLDVAVSAACIVVFSPILLILGLAIRLGSPGPAIFKQKRVGKGCAHFTIYKFRTMRSDAPKDVPTHLLGNPEQLMTPIGRFMRKTSLDELPQLLNIIKGDMSFVGPRPALWNQYDLVEERGKYGANDALPGLTGWAQVNGRDELPIPVKARLDGEYVRLMGPALDIKITFMTVSQVFRGRGVVEGAQNGERNKP